MRESDRRDAIRAKLARMVDQREADPIPTGFDSLDRLLGGGWPRGAIVEIFGASSAGKSSLALQSIAQVQMAGLSAAWIDADRSFDGVYAAKLGVSIERLPVAQPVSAEEALDVCRQLVASGAVDLLVIDSLAALTPQLELDAGLGESSAGLHGRVLWMGLRRIASAAARSGACVLVLNQVRTGKTGGVEKETSAGGPGLKLYAAVRVGLSASGRRVKLRVLKNRMAAAPVDAELLWRPNEGFTERM